MLVIRLFRVGKKHQPSFKIVVTDKRKPPRSGRFVEEVGFYNSLTKEKVLKAERIKYWLSVGAKPSATVYNLLISEKILEGKKTDVSKKAKKKTTTLPPPSPPEGGAPEKPAEETKVETAEAATETKKEEKEVKEIPETQREEVKQEEKTTKETKESVVDL